MTKKNLLTKLSYIKEFELIFIDDCSTDNSAKIIQKFMYYDDRIKLIRNKKIKEHYFQELKEHYTQEENILFG